MVNDCSIELLFDLPVPLLTCARLDCARLYMCQVSTYYYFQFLF